MKLFQNWTSCISSRVGLLEMMPPSMYLLSPGEKYVGAKVFFLHLNPTRYFTSRGSPYSLPQLQPIRVVETEFCVLIIACWQFVVAHHLQPDRKVVCTSRSEYQSVNYKIK